jgi:hypothetical protein
VEQQDRQLRHATSRGPARWARAAPSTTRSASSTWSRTGNSRTTTRVRPR